MWVYPRVHKDESVNSLVERRLAGQKQLHGEKIRLYLRSTILISNTFVCGAYISKSKQYGTSLNS
jgi:hypothetical protein